MISLIPPGALSLPEIRGNFRHPFHLIYMEGTSAVTVTAPDTVCGSPLQGPVMFSGQGITDPGQIIVFIDQPDIQPCRTGWQCLQYTQLPFVSSGVKEPITE